MWKNNNKFGVVSFLFVWGNNKPLNRNWSLQQPFRKKSSSRIELKIPILSSVHTNSWMPTLLVLSDVGGPLCPEQNYRFVNKIFLLNRNTEAILQIFLKDDALEDIFEIKNINPDGKKFDKVSRLICDSENYEMDLILDVNTDVYPVELSERLTLALATSLDVEGRGELGYWDYGRSDRASLSDRYEYVMYGRVFKYQPDSKQEKVSVYVSFGGLLMRLTGDPRNMQQIKPDMPLYLLVRKNAQ